MKTEEIRNKEFEMEVISRFKEFVHINFLSEKNIKKEEILHGARFQFDKMTDEAYIKGGTELVDALLGHGFLNTYNDITENMR